jgi:hypothetical protein
MPDQDSVAALIERVVAEARIPGRARRDDLRRELWTHFEQTGTSPTAAREAIRRFGAEALITESLRHVYRRDYAFWYVAKIAAAIIASTAAALLIQVLVNVRIALQAEAWRLTAGFSRGAGISIAVVLGVITAWEAARLPFNRSRAVVAIGAYGVVGLLVPMLLPTGVSPFVFAAILVGIGYLCSKLERWPSRLIVLFGAFAAALYIDHLVLSVAFGPSRALVAGAVLVAVWSSTVVILNRVDRAFVSLFGPADRHAF